ncbi:MAG TPA: chemotaxis protein CheB [Bryobacteraceae bacterium]|nr:chemotaxis protein CheB [Bryobacteraceae bacterium]
MAARDIIVIGGSAGSVEALTDLVQRLPPDLPASMFVVIHMAPHMPSDLATILDRAGPLPAEEAKSGAVFQSGHIYVAAPDRHLMLDNGSMHLWRGPRENRHRPAVNVLFRSAAVGYGPRVAGVVLSGTLDDGTAGLWWIKRHGGLAIVQDPSDARFPDMIYSALEHVEVDHIASIVEMGDLFGTIVNGAARKAQEQSGSDRRTL